MGWLGGGTSLTVEEEDGSPSISGVSKIQVSNATLTDDGAGTVSMSMSPAGGANVALSNVDAQTAARVFAGPASGAAAAPTFRAIATTDLKTPDASGFLASNGAGVLSWATPAGTGANTALSNLASVAINAILTTANGQDLWLIASAQNESGESDAGVNVLIQASNAVAGTVTPGAAAGGSVTIEAGDAARLTSGNANGGDITLAPGAGIGTGSAGSVLPGSDNAVPFGSAAKRFTTGFASTGWAIYKAASEANPTAILGDGVLNFGAGTTNAVDTGLARAGAASAKVTNGSSGYGSLILTGLEASADGSGALGSAAKRFTTGFASTGWAIYKAASDANPTATLADGAVKFGAGGASAVDVGLIRYKYLTNPTEVRVSDGSTGNGNLRIGPETQYGTVIRPSASNYYIDLVTGDYGNLAGVRTSLVDFSATLWGFTDASVIKFGTTPDTGLARPAAGVLSVTDGSTGFGAASLDTNSKILADTVTLSDNVKTAVVDIAIADGEFIGGTLTYTITATDATDHQALTGIVGFSGVRKNGTPDTYHLTIAESASPVLAESNGASTLADTWAIDAGTNVATISVTADSSLTTPTMTVRYQLLLNSANAVTKKA